MSTFFLGIIALALLPLAIETFFSLGRELINVIHKFLKPPKA